MAFPENATKFKETVSLASEQDLLQKLIHRVAQDNTIAHGALEILSNIAINTTPIGNNQRLVVLTGTDATKNQLIAPINNGERIIIYDITLSSNGIGNFTFPDQDNNDLLSVFYAAAAGDQMIRTSRGIILPEGKTLSIKCSAAITYSIDIVYTILES